MDGPRRIIKTFRVNDLEDLQVESASDRIGEPVGRFIRNAVLRAAENILEGAVEASAEGNV